jgi:apolipoprotein N-acyltransferase
VLAALADPPVDAGRLALVALVPLLFALREARPARGALLGLVFGLVSFSLLLGWLRLFGVIAWLPLVVVEALYLTVFGALWPVLRGRGRQPWRAPLSAAALWTALEWVRATWPIGGFTWGGIGYTQHTNRFVLPLASVTGVWGIAFVVVLVNALVLEAAAAEVRRWGRGAAVVVALAALVAPALIPLAPARGPAVDVAIVQGNVPRALASDLLLRGDTVEANEISLHRTLASDPPALAVWPENSLDQDPRLDPQLQSKIASVVRTVGAPTLVGGVSSAGGRLFNTIFAYGPDGRILETYDKVHLVPFGEYVPFGSFFRWTERYRRGNADFTPGSRIRVFRLAGTTVGTPICFENAFPNLFRSFVSEGARLMVVTTNDSSFLRSPASREHVEFSELRAVETGRWVVQAAVSGESAVVDPRGRVVARTGLFTREILRFDIPTSTVRTLYVRFGDWFPWGCGIAVLLSLAWIVPGRGRGRATRARRDAPPAGERAVRVPRDPAPISGGADPRTLVILPTYNERETIGTVACAVLALGPAIDVLVIDDASPDGTGDVVAALAEREGRIRLLRRDGKLGLASAYLTGFARAVEEGYDLAVEMDADLSHQPQDLPRLIEGSARSDLTIGSRYVPGGAVSNWSRARLLLSRAGNAYARAVLRLPVRDATSGFRVFRRDLLRWLIADGIHSDGYGFQVEVAYRAWRAGYAVTEVPITFREREHGRSKLSRRIVLEALVEIARWGLRDRVVRSPSP